MLFAWLKDGATLREMLEERLFELEINYLEVVLIPASEQKHSGHCIRAVAYANAKWYKDFCASHGASRRKPKRSFKPDTRIKREHTVKALNRMLAGNYKGLYAERLLEHTLRELSNRKSRARVAAEMEAEDYDYGHCPF